jgi:hypothetical protein
MKLAISTAVLAVMSLLLGFVVHAVLLAPDYHALGGLFRTPEDGQAHFGYMLLAHLLIGIGFTWIYLKGREAKPFFAQGIRFGLAVRGAADARVPRRQADRARYDFDGADGDRLRVDQPGARGRLAGVRCPPTGG